MRLLAVGCSSAYGISIISNNRLMKNHRPGQLHQCPIQLFRLFHPRALFPAHLLLLPPPWTDRGIRSPSLGAFQSLVNLVSALDDIIAQASNDYIRAFHTHNVIGHGNRWQDGRIFKCAAKGDVNRYSRVLNDPVVGEHFTRYLGNEFENCRKEVEYAALESGDSVVLVDDSADRVLSAARSLQQTVRRFQVPQDFRFGAAVGAIAFSTTTRVDGQNARI